ncbi:AcrR family transcriptional regulator [Roseovarius sp. MBR-154]|jgi:AcrR family transcriptional regulator
MIARRRPRLTRDDWLLTGLTALCEGGPGTLGAEPLARRVGATKGSFYWHFNDVPGFQAALLALWQTEAEAALLDAQGATATARLRATAQTIADSATSDSPALRSEPAIRAWAQGNALAARVVAGVDDIRLARLHDLLAACGIGNPEMARILYASATGMQGLQSLQESACETAATAIGSLVDLILALR